MDRFGVKVGKFGEVCFGLGAALFVTREPKGERAAQFSPVSRRTMCVDQVFGRKKSIRRRCVPDGKVKVDAPACLIGGCMICGVAWRERAEGDDVRRLVALPLFLAEDKL